MSGPHFNKDDIRKFLAEHGYTSHPEGLIELYPFAYVSETEGVAYLDINAIPVRKGDEVPDRPVRMTFRRIPLGPSFQWELESVAELAPAVETKASNREDTPKVSPWPDKNAKKSE
jgi:hypothetical protein